MRKCSQSRKQRPLDPMNSVSTRIGELEPMGSPSFESAWLIHR